MTLGEQCGFMLMFQLKGPALITMLAENKKCPLKEWAWGPCLKSYFAMPHRNKAGPVHRVLFFLSHCTKAPQTHPHEDSQTMRLKAENKHLMPALTYFEPLFKSHNEIRRRRRPPVIRHTGCFQITPPLPTR